MKNSETTTAIEMPPPNLKEMKEMIRQLEQKHFDNLCGLCCGILQAGIQMVRDERAPKKTITLLVSEDIFYAVQGMVQA